MKLTKIELNALASKIYREIATDFETKRAATKLADITSLQNLCRERLEFAKKALSNVSFNFKLDVHVVTDMRKNTYYYSNPDNITDYEIRKIMNYPKLAVTQEQIVEDLIIGSIDVDSTLDTLIESIKAKYEITY